MIAIAIAGKAGMDIEAGMTAGDHVEHPGARDSAQHLDDDVARQARGRETPARPQADRDSGIEMAAGDMADGEGHGQHRQAEGQRHADKTDTQGRKGGGQHGRTASAQYQPGCSDEFRGKLAGHDPPSLCYSCRTVRPASKRVTVRVYGLSSSGLSAFSA